MPAVPLTVPPSFEKFEEFFVGLDFAAVNAQWRVYHNTCATDLTSHDYDLDLGDVIRLINSHSCPPPLTPTEALDFAIFAVNNHTDPDASTEDDVARMEKNAAEVVESLGRLRDYVVASGEDLPDWVLSGDVATEIDGDTIRSDKSAWHRLGTVVEKIEKIRPLSDFAIHLGLIPRGYDGSSTGVWIDGRLYRGQAEVDLSIDEIPGLYLDGTWTEWGETSDDDSTSHLVYRLESVQGTNLTAIMGGLLSYLRENGSGQLTEVAYITEVTDYAEKVGVIPLADFQTGAVIPRDWRTR